MISERLKKIFFISIPIYMLHNVEEYVAFFYNLDFMVSYSWKFKIPPKHELFWIWGVFWIILLVSYLLLRQNKLAPPVLFILGFILYIYQLEHIGHTIIFKDYYPGLVTGAILNLVGFFFWKEMLKTLK